MKFRELAIGQTFDWINDAKPMFNSFYLTCTKTSARKYVDSTGQDHRVGSINADCYHVQPTEGSCVVMLSDPEVAKQPASYAPEVIADDSGKWVGNGLRFATKDEAEKNVRNLMMRWFLVRETRVVESSDPVNYKWVDGVGLEMVKA